MRGDIFALGMFLVILGVAVLTLPIFEDYSVLEMTSQCGTLAGQLGRALSPEARKSCSEVLTLRSISYILLIAGICLMIYGAIAKDYYE